MPKTEGMAGQAVTRTNDAKFEGFATKSGRTIWDDLARARKPVASPIGPPIPPPAAIPSTALQSPQTHRARAKLRPPTKGQPIPAQFRQGPLPPEHAPARPSAEELEQERAAVAAAAAADRERARTALLDRIDAARARAEAVSARLEQAAERRAAVAAAAERGRAARELAAQRAAAREARAAERARHAAAVTDAVVDAYQAGHTTIGGIERATGHSWPTVQRVLRDNGLQPTSGHKNRAAPTSVIDVGERGIVLAYQSGAPVSGIARATHLSRPTIYRVLRRNGVELRNDRALPPGERFDPLSPPQEEQ